MMEENSFKFACPHCGQHIKADVNMVGMDADCPACGQPFKVPGNGDESKDLGVSGERCEPNHSPVPPREEAEVAPPIPPVIQVIKKRERFIDRCKKRVKAVGIGVVVLLLFVGVAVINELSNERETSLGGNGDAPHRGMSKARSNNAAVAESVECLLNFVRVPTERKLRVLTNSLNLCPADFRDAVKEFLVSSAKTSDDMIPAREREEMAKGRAVLGLLLGAASQNDPQSGVAAGLQLGDLICAEAEKKANMRLKEEIETKRSHLIDVAERYGVNPNAFENALLGQ